MKSAFWKWHTSTILQFYTFLCLLRVFHWNRRHFEQRRPQQHERIRFCGSGNCPAGSTQSPTTCSSASRGSAAWEGVPVSRWCPPRPSPRPRCCRGLENVNWKNQYLGQSLYFSVRSISHETFMHTILWYCYKKILWFLSIDFYWPTKVSSYLMLCFGERLLWLVIETHDSKLSNIAVQYLAQDNEWTIKLWETKQSSSQLDILREIHQLLFNVKSN